MMPRIRRKCKMRGKLYKSSDEEEISDPEEIANKDEKCKCCGQLFSNILVYQGHPQYALDEELALASEKLADPSGNETIRHNLKTSDYAIYDKEGHLVPLELMESNKFYLSGYLKRNISSSDNTDIDSVPVKDVGPIVAWYVMDSDDGESMGITLSTLYADYKLLKPSSHYSPHTRNLKEKLWILKVVVDFLDEYICLHPTYEELLDTIKRHAELDDKPLPVALLQEHAHFLCELLASMDAKRRSKQPYMGLACMRELKKHVSTDFGRRPVVIEYKKPNKKAFSKATTTPLVKKVFEGLFREQMQQTNREEVKKRSRCGICKPCQRPDCGECSECKAMPKFGGHRRSKKPCERRLCPNMGGEPPDQSDSEHDTDDDAQEANDPSTSAYMRLAPEFKWFKWIGQPIERDKKKIYYAKVEMEGIEYRKGDIVMVKTAKPHVPSLIARIVCLYKFASERDIYRKGYFHAEFFIRSVDTVLGEVGHPREVFASDKCRSGIPIFSILRKARVEKKEIPKDWFQLGGESVEEDNPVDDDGRTYFYSKHYDLYTGRFIDVPETPACPNPFRQYNYCSSCERMKIRELRTIPRVENMLPVKSPIVRAFRNEWAVAKWQDHEYKKGGGVFLKPKTFKLPNKLKRKAPKMETNNLSDDIYTELYRKKGKERRPKDIIGKPFCVGYIVAVCGHIRDALVPPDDMYLVVNVMYRPENTKIPHPEQEDMNMVYWSEVVKEVPFKAVAGPCHLIYEGNIPQQGHSIQEWLEEDPRRVYFKSAYNRATGKASEVPNYAKDVGKIERAKLKGHGKGSSGKASDERKVVVRPLRTLDVFAGCGGLSAGLHRAGVAHCRWAVENDEAAAHAYSLNNERCTVFTQDCNELLREVMAGTTHVAGKRVPMRGEVELLCGGPPCQGFSGMNRFNSLDYSLFKNSLVVSFLSYCDYYRPKYFILENVRNFVAFKQGMVLKLTMRALLDMGYQCTFGVLQAGSYGVPQTRRRVFLLAAAPGRPLPRFPEPSHSFLKRACSQNVMVDGKRFKKKILWEHSAPRRALTVRDAISDLPSIRNGASRLQMEYGTPAQCHYQRSARGYGEGMLRDHICKKMAPLAVKRMEYLSSERPDVDWRDLPNISVMLSNGVRCQKLQYRYKNKAGLVRGVCACATGRRACQPQDRQENTLIPWFLPHTADRHAQWAGLYGRLQWDGWFSTTITDPEPSGKQGRVVHPRQARVVSVRECARSQGFPDHYVFTGSVLDKHRQIGNAVPPPLAEALGREIMKCIIASGDY